MPVMGGDTAVIADKWLGHCILVIIPGNNHWTLHSNGLI